MCRVNMCDSIEATFKIHNNNKIGTKYIETFTSIFFFIIFFSFSQFNLFIHFVFNCWLLLANTRSILNNIIYVILMSYIWIMLCIRFVYSICYALKQKQTNTASSIKFLIVLFNYTYIGGGISSSRSITHVRKHCIFRCWLIDMRNVYHHINFRKNI